MPCKIHNLKYISFHLHQAIQANCHSVLHLLLLVVLPQWITAEYFFSTLYFNNSCSQLRSVNRLGRGSGWRYLWCHCVGFSVLPWMWCVISSSWLFLVLDFIVSILGMLRMLYWAEKGREKIDHFGQECLYGKNTLDIHQWDAARKIFLIFLLSWL